MKNKLNWKSVFTVMGAILAFNIGTGFATGQEVMQYFSVFGWWSILGGVAFAATMAYGLYCFAYASERFGLKDGESVLKYYLGNILGTIINYFYIFYLYMCVIVMYSGAAAALNEQYGAPNWVGALIIAALCCITSIFGLKRIVDIISKLGPILIGIALIIAIIAVVQGAMNGSLHEGAQMVANGEITHLQASNSWLIAGVILATSTILWYPNFIVELKNENTMKDLMIGQTIGNTLVGAAEVIMGLAMIANIAAVADLDVPFLYVASQMFSGFGPIYALMIFTALYTTTCPLLWSSIAPFAEDGSKKYKMLVVIGTVVGFIVAMLVPYDVIMNYVWVISGWVGEGVMVIMIIRIIYNRIKYGANYCKPTAEALQAAAAEKAE